MNYLVVLLYLASVALFIYGLMGLTGPKTAVRGNWIAAAGMAVAVIATLISIRHTENWGLIIAGLLVGVALGVPPARLVKMTAMPQLVAFYNGVGGGTVALIALSEFIDTHGFSDVPAWRVADRAHRGGVAVRRDHRVDLVLGFDHRVRQAAGDPARPADRRRQAPAAAEHPAADRCDRRRGGDRRQCPSRQWRGVAVVDDRPAGRRGRARVDGGAADRRRRHASRHFLAECDDRVVRGCSGFGAEQHRDDRRRHDRRRVRFDPDQPDGQGDEPLHPRDRRRRVRWRRGRGRRWRRRATRWSRPPRRPTPRSRWPTPTRSSSCPATAWPSPRPSTPSRTWRACSRTRAFRSSTRSTRWQAGCPGT